MVDKDLALMAADGAIRAGLAESSDVPMQANMVRIEEHPAWDVLSSLPMRLSASIPMNRLTVRHLLELRAEQVLESAWPDVKDVPLKVGEVCLAWTEFEASAGVLGVRLTRLA